MAGIRKGEFFGRSSSNSENIKKLKKGGRKEGGEKEGREREKGREKDEERRKEGRK